MENYEEEYNLDELFGHMKKNITKDIKTFEDLINLDGALRREIYVYAIEDGLGSSVDGQIRFWNTYDNEHNIPIDKREPIKIYIDSCGGSLVDTLAIVDAIKMSKTPVYTIAIGCAYSGGFFIFISGHKRIAYPHSTFLFHEGSTSNGGTSSQFENYTAFYKKILLQLQELVLNNTNISEKEYKEIHKEDIWYDAKDGIEKGFVDKIAEDFI